MVLFYTNFTNINTDMKTIIRKDERNTKFQQTRDNSHFSTLSTHTTLSRDHIRIKQTSNKRLGLTISSYSCKYWYLQEALSTVVSLVIRAALYNFPRHQVYLLTGHLKSVRPLLMFLYSDFLVVRRCWYKCTLFTALHWMQGGLVARKVSVRQSVCLSVR